MQVTKQHYWVESPIGEFYACKWQSSATENNNIPFVLFHDSLGCTALWKTFPEALCLATGQPVITYDRPGFGLSTKRRKLFTSHFIREEASIVLPRLLQCLKISNFIALGHSVGGSMALQAAAQYQHRCRAVITLGTQAYTDKKTKSGIKESALFFQDQKNFLKLKQYHGNKTENVLHYWINTWLSKPFDNWSILPAAQSVICPTLVIHGDQDEYSGLEQAHDIANAVNGASEVSVLKNTAHNPHRTTPTELAVLIQGFSWHSLKLPHPAERLNK